MASHSTSTSAQAAPGDGTDLRMHRDWQQLCEDRRAQDAISAWAERDELLTGCLSAADVLELMKRLYKAGDWQSHDQVFAALLERVGEAGFEGEVAWRIAVKAMLPWASKMARSQVRIGTDFDEVFSVVVSVLFETIRTFPLDRTRKNLYSGLALRTLTLTRETLGYRTDQCLFPPEVMAEILDGRQSPHLEDEPEERFERVSLLLDAAELHLLCADDPTHIESNTARAEVLRLVVWAVDTEVLQPAEAREISHYYVTDHQRRGQTTRAMGAEGARQRKARSRGVRRLCAADHNAYFEAVA